MVTGGFRTATGMNDAISKDGISAIGIGRPLCGDPHCTSALLQFGKDLPRYEKMLGQPASFFGVNSPLLLIKLVASFSVMAWYYDQIVLLGNGQPNDYEPRPLRRFLALQKREVQWLKARKAWLAEHRQEQARV
jgi:hypothetical protein